MKQKPVRFGVVGIGGFATAYVDSILALQKSGKAQLTSAVVRNPAKYPDRVKMLQGEGAKIFADAKEMVQKNGAEMDIIGVPTGIDSHEELTVFALENGFDVLCEKPVAGTVQEVDHMIEVKNRVKKLVAVGFQSIYHEQTQRIKSIICSGELGAFKNGVMQNFMARQNSYYTRNNWAGRYKAGNHWVMDSPFCNAMAHPTQLMQYLTGPSLSGSANVVSITAELYRAKVMETYDTFCVKMELDTGGTLINMGTHSCQDNRGYTFRLNFEKGAIIADRKGTVIIQNGKKQELPNVVLDQGRPFMFPNLIESFYSRTDPLCTLENARPHTLAVDGASESCPNPYEVPREFLEERFLTEEAKAKKDPVIAIKGIEEILGRCFEENKMISEIGIPWAVKGKPFDLRNYRRFPVSKSFAK